MLSLSQVIRTKLVEALEKAFPDFVSITGAKPIFVNTNSNSQYEPDFVDLKSKITSKTKAIIINSPSNPTGGVWSDAAILEIISIANSIDAWIISDK